MYRETKELPVTETRPDRPTKISWRQLDNFTRASEIAEFLHKHNIRGLTNKPDQCPLARATGWSVGGITRSRQHWWGGFSHANLTTAEMRFIFNFDRGSYPYLIG